MSLGAELGLKKVIEDENEHSDEDIILAGAPKIKSMYDRADDNNEVCNSLPPFSSQLIDVLHFQILISVLKRDKLFPKTCSFDAFVKVKLMRNQILVFTLNLGFTQTPDCHQEDKDCW